MSDLISRADAIEAVRKEYEDAINIGDNGDAIAYDVGRILSALPSADAKGANLINRHDATTVIREECWKCNRLINDDLLGRILALPTSRQTDCTEFIEWLIEIILDDEDWELNAVGYGEIIARKMAKLGLLEVLDGYYIRTPNKPQSVVAEIKIDTDDIIKQISALPSAEADMSEYCDRLWKIAYERGKREASAEAVQGEWIMVKGSNGKDYHKCSKCLHTQEITGVKNYCAVCGARMKGGADE